MDIEATWWGPDCIVNEEGLRLRYGVDDCTYEGDDWIYYYQFNRKNTAKLFTLLTANGSQEEAFSYIEEHFSSMYTLESFCKEHGVHGKRTDYGDYPSAVYGPYEICPTDPWISSSSTPINP